MLYRIVIEGVSPIIHHSAAGIDQFLPINEQKKEITRKRSSNRTASDEARLRELETVGSLWLNADNEPTIPRAALRAVLERGATKLKQASQVKEGLVVTSTQFDYDKERYGVDLDVLQKSVQFTTSVVVQRNRVMRTRARFDLPWSCTFEVDVDDELVDDSKLRQWLDIGGRRIGLGDWRPEKSGEYGRFELVSIEAVE